MEEFEQAKDKIMMGTERRSMVMSEKEKLNTAYHEAGHAIVGYIVPDHDPVHKVTIIPRGMALGVTAQLPDHDKYNYSKSYLLAKLDVLMGGRCAEKLIFNDTSSGAGNDIEVATNIARKMVTEWGMSDKIGPAAFGSNDDEMFLGREISRPKNHGEGISQIIDNEIKDFILTAEKNADNLLKKREDQLHILAKALITYESIDSKQLSKILNGQSLEENSDNLTKKTTKKKRRTTIN